jgi:hypothetical protein
MGTHALRDTRTQTHGHRHTRTHTHRHMDTDTRMHTWTHGHTDTQTWTHGLMDMDTRTRGHMGMDAWTHGHTDTDTWAQTHRHRHGHTRTDTWTHGHRTPQRTARAPTAPRLLSRDVPSSPGTVRDAWPPVPGHRPLGHSSRERGGHFLGPRPSHGRTDGRTDAAGGGSARPLMVSEEQGSRGGARL